MKTPGMSKLNKKTSSSATATTTVPNPSNVLMTAPVPDAEAERRLRPVTEALFDRNSKQALKLVQQAITKRPGWPAARALRACIYLQMERFRDAQHEMDVLRADLDARRVPINEDAAAKILLYHQEIRQEGVAAELYEAAWLNNPKQIHLAETAFCLYIRGAAFVSAQRLAFKLHRLLSSSTQKFAFWATASLWLNLVYHTRSASSSAPQPDTRMLKLGCALMSKALDASTTPPSAEIVRLASRVFKHAGDFDSAMQLVSHPRLVMDETEVLHLRAQLAFRSTKDSTDFETLLTQRSPNDWSYWLHYFECIKNNEDWISTARDLANSVLKSIEKEKELPRGPHLALIELSYREEDWDALSKGIVDYFRNFGDTSLAARDLRPWLALMKDLQLKKNTLKQIDEVAEELGFPHLMHGCWLQLWCDNLSTMPVEFVKRHAKLIRNDIEPTDRQEGDEYLTLAAHMLLPCPESGDRLDNPVALLKAIVMLEAGLTHSPFNHDFKLLLLRLYDAIGGMDRMTELWATLDIKHVQLSTLSHIVLKPFFHSGHRDGLEGVVESIDSLWREVDREIPECTSRAIMENSLNAAVDFVLFKLRVERSSTLVEAMITESTYRVIQAGGEPLGVGRALQILTSQPRFVVADLIGEKRILSSEDVTCYRFWDCKDYDPECRLDTLRDDSWNEGKECSSQRLRNLAKSLASLLALLRLTEENGRDNSTVIEGASEKDEIPESLWEMCGEDSEDESLVQLRMDIAKHLRTLKSVMVDLAMSPSSGHANGDVVDSHETNVTRLVEDGEKLAERVMEEVVTVVKETNNEENISMGFPRALRKCGQLVFEVLVIVTVAATSFSPLVLKGVRRMRKSGAKGESQGSREFGQCRGIMTGYRDVLLEAADKIRNWLLGWIEGGLGWCDRVLQHEDMKELEELVEDFVHPMQYDRNTRPLEEGVSRAEFAKAMVESVKSSHSVSCTSLMEALVGMTRRLKLADL